MRGNNRTEDYEQSLRHINIKRVYDIDTLRTPNV